MATGTLNWIERTGGKLGWRDRLNVVAQMVRAQWSARLRGRDLQAARHLAIEDVIPPDTAICKAAEALSREASEPYLFNHCVRAYFWARLYNGKRSIDEEALYIALLLHDLGLTKDFRLKPGEGECFTIVGARAVQRLAKAHRWPDRQAHLTAEAITLHLNVTVSERHSREAHLVRFGSGADVAGLGIRAIPSDQRAAVVDRFPRLNLKRNIVRDLNVEVCAHPECRIALLFKKGAFAHLIRTAPFSE